MRNLALLAVLAITTPALANDPATVAPVAKPAKVKTICKSSGSSASRLGGDKVCKTKAEWDAESEAQTKSLDSVRRQ